MKWIVTLKDGTRFVGLRGWYEVITECRGFHRFKILSSETHPHYTDHTLVIRLDLIDTMMDAKK